MKVVVILRWSSESTPKDEHMAVAIDRQGVRQGELHTVRPAAGMGSSNVYPATVISAHIWLRPTPRTSTFRPPPTVFTQLRQREAAGPDLA